MDANLNKRNLVARKNKSTYTKHVLRRVIHLYHKPNICHLLLKEKFYLQNLNKILMHRNDNMRKSIELEL